MMLTCSLERLGGQADCDVFVLLKVHATASAPLGYLINGAE
jgi:hypothetical protein